MLPIGRLVFVGTDPGTNLPLIVPSYPAQEQQQEFILPQNQISTAPNNVREFHNFNVLQSELNQLRTENMGLRAELNRFTIVAEVYCSTLSNEIESYRVRCESLSRERGSLLRIRRNNNTTINVLMARLAHSEEKVSYLEATLQYVTRDVGHPKQLQELSNVEDPLPVKDCPSINEASVQVSNVNLIQHSVIPDEVLTETNDEVSSNENAPVQDAIINQLNDMLRDDVTSKQSPDVTINEEASLQAKETGEISIQYISNDTETSHESSRENETLRQSQNASKQVEETSVEVKKNTEQNSDVELLDEVVSEERLKYYRLQTLILSNNIHRTRKYLRQKENEVHRLTAYQIKANCVVQPLESRVKYLETTLIEKDRLNEHNKAKRIKNETDLIEARKNCIKLESKINEMTESLLRMTQRNEMLRNDVKRLKNDKHKLNELNVSEAERSFESRLKKLDLNLATSLEEESRKEKEQINVLQVELAEKKETVENLMIKNSQLQENISQLETELTASKSEISGLKNTLKLQENNNDDAQLEITCLKETISNLETRLSRAEEVPAKTVSNETQASNCETRRKYSREYLLSFQNCPVALARPLNLPKSTPTLKQNKLWPVLNFEEWNPSYHLCDSNEPQNKKQEIEIIPTKPKEKNVTLKDEEIYKKCRSLLNKLTPEKFDKLLFQFKDLSINSVARLEGVAELLVEKASREPHFAEMYARLCSELSEVRAGTSSLQSTLLVRYDREFERMRGVTEDRKRTEMVKQISESSDKKELELELEEYDAKTVRRNVGFCTFLGELFNYNIIESKTLFTCINCLMKSNDKEALECLCKIMSKVGATLESQKDNKHMINTFFNDVKTKLDGTDVNDSRLRFMLMDLREMRIMDWKPRNKDNKPVTLAEIDREVNNDPMTATPNDKKPWDRQSVKPTPPQRDFFETPSRKTEKVGSQTEAKPRPKIDLNKIKAHDSFMPDYLKKKY